MVQGEVLVREAAACAFAMTMVIARESDAHLLARTEAANADEFWLLDDKVFDSLNDTVTPQGILAVCRMPSLGRSLAEVDGWILVADRVADPGNLGTILRTAEAAGAAALVVTAGTVDAFSPKSVRASAGAILHVPVHSLPDLRSVRESGFRLVGTTSHLGPNVQQLWDVDFGGRVALVVGNEAHGLDRDAPLDVLASIPHVGRAESMNVGMATAVAAIQVARWRQMSPRSAN